MAMYSRFACLSVCLSVSLFLAQLHYWYVCLSVYCTLFLPFYRLFNTRVEIECNRQTDRHIHSAMSKKHRDDIIWLSEAYLVVGGCRLAAINRSRHAWSRITRGTLYWGLYDDDDDDDDDVIRRLSWWKEPRATWWTRMESMLPAARSWQYNSNVSLRAASNCTENNTPTNRHWSHQWRETLHGKQFSKLSSERR